MAKLLSRGEGKWNYVSRSILYTSMLYLIHDLMGKVGVGRDDGISAGEFSPIFYNSYGFDQVESDFL